MVPYYTGKWVHRARGDVFLFSVGTIGNPSFAGGKHKACWRGCGSSGNA